MIYLGSNSFLEPHECLPYGVAINTWHFLLQGTFTTERNHISSTETMYTPGKLGLHHRIQLQGLPSVCFW